MEPSGSQPLRAGGIRVDWTSVPASVRDGVENELGARITSASSQPHGFSPGPAVRCRLDDDRQVFIKAVSSDMNPDSPLMHRQEILIQRQLPDNVPAPRLLGSYDDGEWVAAIYEDIDGRHPSVPWKAEELRQILADLTLLHEQLTPNPVDVAPTVGDKHRAQFGGFARLAGRDPSLLDPWVSSHLGELVALESRWESATEGTTLLHGDVRGDNILLTGEGEELQTWFVDWPGACVGVPWFDIVGMAPSVALEGGPSPAELIRLDPVARNVVRHELAQLVAALGGYFLYGAQQPPPPGLPTVRTFQARQGAVVVEWLRQLIET